MLKTAGYLMLFCAALAACSSSDARTADSLVQADPSPGVGPADRMPGEANGLNEELPTLRLPALASVDLQGNRLRVVATTSIIGDVVRHVGGEAILLDVIMTAGHDPHSFEPNAGHLARVAEAHVIFVNGWGLEESLLNAIREIATQAPIIPVSANIRPIPFKEEKVSGPEADVAAVDPHTWLDPHLVLQWVDNVESILKLLDPANASNYRRNAADYSAKLVELIDYYDGQVASIRPERRKLVTNHHTLGYFAAAYGFQIMGAVIPSSSTLAEPSARDLAEIAAQMEAEGVCTIFSDDAFNEKLAQAVAAELGNCSSVSIVTLFTGALGSTGSGADSYVGMMKANIDAIANALT